jgi:hypothetical protein
MIRVKAWLGIMLGWLAGSLAFADTPTWRWSNPTPHGAHIFALASKGSTVVEAGEFGQAFASDDLVTWRPLATGVTNMLRAATWFGPRLVITGESGLVLYSDTLEFFHTVDLQTEDWIEGVAASNNRIVAVGDNGAIYVSSDGTNWQRGSDAAEWLHSVAFGNNVFVAVGDAGLVIVSSDGSKWSGGGSRLTSKDLNRVTWSGNQFWILGNEGVAFRSASGSDWETVNVGTTNDLFSAASNGNEAVIVGRSELRTSTPPFDTWTSQTGDSPAPAVWTYYSSLWDGAEFLVGGRSGMFVEGFQPTNSASFAWLSDGDAPRNWLWGLCRMGGIYAACGEQGGIFTSLDGFRFDQEAVPASAATEILEGIGGTTNMLVSVGTGGVVLVSPGGFTNIVSTNSVGDVVTNEVNLLGLVWNEVSPRPTVNELQGVGVLGSTYIVTGGNGTILTSDDAQTWTPRLNDALVMLSSVACSDSRAVVVGDLGTVLTSEDAVIWANRSSGVTNWIYRARYLNGQFVAVGEAGLILTSPDGLTWTRRDSGTDHWLNGVNYQSGNYYVAGSQGVLLQSPDAINWTAAPVPTGKSLYDLAGENDRLVSVGIEGAALRARLAPWTTPVNFLSYNVATNTQAFLFSGELDERFTLQRSPDMRRWVDIAPVEILDNSGSSLFYDSLVAGAQWFFRTAVLPP